MDITRHETYNRFFTKKVKASLNTAGSGGVALTDEVIWKPAGGDIIMVLYVFSKLMALTGNPNAWRVLLERGSTALVSSVIPATVETVGNVEGLTIATQALPIDYDHPLTLTTTLDSVATIADIELVIVGLKVNDLF